MKKEGRVVVVSSRERKRAGTHTHTKRDTKTRLNRDLYVKKYHREESF